MGIGTSNLTALQSRVDLLERQLLQLQLMHDVNLDLTSTLDLDRVLLKILERVTQTIGSTTASILLLEGQELVFQYSIGDKADQIKPFRVPLGVGISGIVGQTRQASYSNDVPNDPRYYRTVDAGVGYHTQSLMAAPLVVNDRLIGVISATNKEGGFSEADLELIDAIGAAAGIALENARLYSLAVEQGRLERELQMAREVQMHLIPTETPQVPGWQFAALYKPAREVSGDLYDFIPLDDNRIVALIADVSDKGMPAALFMSLSRSVLRASAAADLSPAQSITRANRLISADANDGMFVTAFYALLDLEEGKIQYVNAGHNPPLLLRSSTSEIVELRRTGIALGVDDSSVYQEGIEEFHEGDSIVMYTDGVTDAENGTGDEFGEARLRGLLATNSHLSPQSFVNALDRHLCDFMNGAAQFDDITVVVAKRGD